MSFLNIRFPDNISYGAMGGPEYSTNVVEITSGFEQRNQNWSLPRFSTDVAHAARLAEQHEELIAFFHIARGKANSFLFKDWADYKVTILNGTLGETGLGTGELTYQLYKQYVNDGGSQVRKITRPVENSVIAYLNGVALVEGIAAGNISINYSTGVITRVPDLVKNINANVAKTITGITQANPGVVTATAHGFANGDKHKITGVVGMTQVNNLYFTVTVVDADHYSIGVNTTGYGAYVSGGTATKYGISQTATATVYSDAHTFTNGQVVYLSSIGGMTEVNNLAVTVANASTNRFDLSGIDSSAYTAYTSGGTISLSAQPSDELTWAGQFDIPCRFDTDKLIGEHIAPGIFGWSSIPIIEVRE